MDREAELRRYNLKILAIGSSILILLLLGIGWVVAINIDQYRSIAQYPGSRPVSSHTNYNGLPSTLVWDDSYITTDDFSQVYNWYSSTFDLGTEAAAMERCVYLEGVKDSFGLQRFTGVFICETEEGNRMFVHRVTTYK